MSSPMSEEINLTLNHCELCNKTFKVYRKHYEHHRDRHSEQIELSFGTVKFIVTRQKDDSIKCPLCENCNFTVFTAVRRHMYKKHENVVGKKPECKKKNPTTANEDTEDDEDEDEVPEMTQSDLSLMPSQQETAEALLAIRSSEQSRSLKRKPTKVTYETALRSATNSSKEDSNDQLKIPALMEVLNFNPVLLTDEEGKEYYLLASNETLCKLPTNHTTRLKITTFPECNKQRKIALSYNQKSSSPSLD